MKLIYQKLNQKKLKYHYKKQIKKGTIMIRIEVKHVNEPDQLSEVDVFKFNNGDTVFFII